MKVIQIMTLFAESQDACDLVRDRGERLRSAMLIYKKNSLLKRVINKQNCLNNQEK
jgi:hypothetical protein